MDPNGQMMNTVTGARHLNLLPKERDKGYISASLLQTSEEFAVRDIREPMAVRLDSNNPAPMSASLTPVPRLGPVRYTNPPIRIDPIWYSNQSEIVTSKVKSFERSSRKSRVRNADGTEKTETITGFTIHGEIHVHLHPDLCQVANAGMCFRALQGEGDKEEMVNLGADWSKQGLVEMHRPDIPAEWGFSGFDLKRSDPSNPGFIESGCYPWSLISWSQSHFRGQ